MFAKECTPKMERIFQDKTTGTIEYCTNMGKISFSNTSGPCENLVFDYPCQAVLGLFNLTQIFFASESIFIGRFQGRDIYKIKKIGFLSPLEDIGNTYTLDICNLIEQNEFYYAFEEIESEFLWNKIHRESFLANIQISSPIQASSPASINVVGSRISVAGSRINVAGASMSINRKKANRVKLKDLLNEVSIKPTTVNKLALRFYPTVENPLPNFKLAHMFCGYFETFRAVGESPMIYTLLSMISTKRIGPRMLSRGANAEGDSAFFVETSFSTWKDGKMETVKFIRGSVPLFWKQDDPLRPNKIDISEEDCDDAFEKHFIALEQRYGPVVVLDLLGKKKYERLLSHKYKESCKASGITYIHFDVNGRHLEPKEIKEYFKKKMAKIPLKDYIIRFNCLDCLDRTNYMQYVLCTLFCRMDNKALQQLWRNNGNALSNFYTGSDALRDELSTKGKQNVFGKMNDLFKSASRMIQNKFTDKDKEKAINLLLGKL